MHIIILDKANIAQRLLNKQNICFILEIELPGPVKLI